MGNNGPVARVRSLWSRYGDRVVWWSLLLVLGAFLVGSAVPPVGDFLASLRFGGPALMVAVALVVLDAVTNDRAKDPNSAGVVVERSSQLAPHFSEALKKRDFSVTFAGYSGETLYRILSDCFAEIERNRTRVETVRIRLLLPDCSVPMSIPCRSEDLSDFVPYRALAERRAEEYVGKIESALRQLEASGGLKQAHFEVRYHRLPPVLKAYVLNDEMCFWGLYPIEQSVYRAAESQGGDVAVYDAKGTRAAMFGASVKAGGSQQVTYENVVLWIDTVWRTVARENMAKTGGS